ncbi:hypothetical protein B0H11DRAFT_1898289 [Mycena galericulata]|nr:hypothetical protein B0H11DRAFT_1898289 [Mycena galericulata]
MRTSSLPSILLLSLVGLSHGRSPAQQNLSTSGSSSAAAMAKWEYINCAGVPQCIPGPTRAGQDLTITVKGRVTETIEDGAYADVAVKLGIVKILQKQFDVCEEARKANASVTCPVQPGDYEVIQTVALPKEIPPALFRVRVRGFTAEYEDMVCLDLDVDFRLDRP